MTSLPSKFSGARWTLRERFTLAGISQLQASGRGLDGETVEVMPTSEHEQHAEEMATYFGHKLDGEVELATELECEIVQLRAALTALHGYLWTGTPDADDLQKMMLITKRALERKEEQP